DEVFIIKKDMNSAALNVNPFMNEIQNLTPQAIDPEKCTKDLSLYEQIHKHSHTVQERQTKQFDLGNGMTFRTPIEAAEYLLLREYGESFLFENDCHERILIPPEFTSNQYFKKSSAVILDYDIKGEMLKVLKNLKKQSPNHWFTKELETFVESQQLHSNSFDNIIPPKEIDQNSFVKWKWNIKVMHLMIQFAKAENLNLPSSILEPDDFTQGCIDQIDTLPPSAKRPDRLQDLKIILSTYKWSRASAKRKINKLITENPFPNVSIKWIMDLELSDTGEKTEHWFFEQLSSNAAANILEDAVILQSVTFMTNVSNKKHQEFDFIIIFWKRKLILGVEIKRQLTDTKAFDQLEKYHKLFEEKLGDQLGHGWIFFPTICVEYANGLGETQHFINKNTDIPIWLSGLLSSFPITPYQIPFIHPLEQLKKVLQIIVFTIHIAKKDLPRPITSSNWVDYINNVMDTLYTVDNIVFYSKSQLPIMTTDHSRYKKLFIRGGYSTGKSFLMQEKAKMLSKDDRYKGKIIYILKGRTDHDPDQLLYHKLKLELPNVKCTTNVRFL
uniref:Uncharacterized protein n=1 Tax=Clytia hemisphaerica TaxID=252671 RepID=A0A7M5X4Q3_9CNID